MPSISISYPGENRQPIQIPEKGLLIGRSPNCTLQLDDEFASDKHCRIYFEGFHVFVEDLRSTNGTTVNGSRVEKCRLEPGNNIEIGSTVIKYQG